MFSHTDVNRHSRFGELPELLSPDEARRFLGLSRTSIYSLLRSGDLEHRRYGRLIRIPRRALASLEGDASSTRV